MMGALVTSKRMTKCVPSNRPAPRTRQRERGLTLVELMVVVVIVGVLATLAVVGYRKLITSSHTAEATHMIQAIRAAEESYRAETGSYVSPSSNLDSDYCPSHSKWPSKVAWLETCGGGTSWSVLPVHTDGPVMFEYAAVSGKAGEAYAAAPSGMKNPPSFGTAKAAEDWFVVAARGDMDGNGVFAYGVGVSWTGDVYIDQEGE